MTKFIWSEPQLISTAPKDKPILAWCDHESDPYELGRTCDGRSKLTLYAGHAEGLRHAPTGWHIVEWGGGWSDSIDDGGAWMPDWWFVAGSEFEIAANPTHWLPLPANLREVILCAVMNERSNAT